MRVPEELVVEGARNWRRVQQFKEWFVDDLKQLLRDNHQHFFEALIGCERILFNVCQRIKQHWTRRPLKTLEQNN